MRKRENERNKIRQTQKSTARKIDGYTDGWTGRQTDLETEG